MPDNNDLCEKRDRNQPFGQNFLNGCHAKVRHRTVVHKIIDTHIGKNNSNLGVTTKGC